MNGKPTLVNAPVLKAGTKAAQEFVAARGCESTQRAEKQTGKGFLGWLSDNSDALLTGIGLVALGVGTIIIATAAAPVLAGAAAAVGAWVGLSSLGAALGTAVAYTVTAAGGLTMLFGANTIGSAVTGKNVVRDLNQKVYDSVQNAAAMASGAGMYVLAPFAAAGSTANKQEEQAKQPTPSQDSANTKGNVAGSDIVVKNDAPPKPVEAVGNTYADANSSPYLAGGNNVVTGKATGTTNALIVNTGVSRPPQTSTPNSVYEQLNPDGTVNCRAFYDADGNQFARQDFGHQHFDKETQQSYQPHEHVYGFNEFGQRNYEGVQKMPYGYDELPTN